MNVEQFWQLLENSKDSDAPEAIAARELEKLAPEAIVFYQEHFDHFFARAYSWDLWGAAYLINGGCSDDGFIDFRYGLIAKGKTVYEKALENPDSLADLEVVKKSKITPKQRRWWTLLIAFASLLIGCHNSPSTLSIVATKIEKDYPRVSHISTATLAEWLEQPNPPILLDIREPEEFAVSHLQGADNVTAGTPIPVAVATVLKAVKKKQRIVVYCSVGYRSAQFAEALQVAGFSNTYNLKGSIFAWANEARPLYRGSIRVQQVHPYNRQWGQLLAVKYRAPLEH